MPEYYYVYMLSCSNGSYYTGYTSDIERRYQEHLNGSSKCKYTRSFPPVELAACWQLFGTAGDAKRVESAIKRLPRIKKEQLQQAPQTISQLIELDYLQSPVDSVIVCS